MSQLQNLYSVLAFLSHDSKKLEIQIFDSSVVMTFPLAFILLFSMGSSLPSTVVGFSMTLLKAVA